MDENVQPSHDTPGYDAVAYSKYVACDFPRIMKLLKYYNMTFDNALDGEIGREQRTSRGPRQFLDIGSGCGVVTKKILLPSVPDDVEKIVGVDLCENMLSYARQHNSHRRIVYEKLDIRGDVSEFLDLYGPFDRIYGFNSLNRVKEQPRAWNNMAKLLKPGGECLLFYSAWFLTPNIWRALAKKKRWSRFAGFWESLIPPTQDMLNTDERLSYVRSLANDVGLELRSSEIVGIYLPVRAWSGIMTSLVPGIDKLTAEQRKLLFQDANEELQNWLCVRQNPRFAENYIIHGVKRMKQPS